MAKSQNKLSAEQQEELLNTLMVRFEKNKDRHPYADWTKLKDKLNENPEKLWVLHEMEITGGEPDVVAYDKKTNEYLFFDCATESPKGRRSLCYDRQAWESRKADKPQNTAVDLARTIGIDLLDEEQYRYLQSLGDFDLKTSSWLKTPESIRKLKGAIFGDKRYDHVFIYHNGAESYYAARGFRGSLKV